MPHVDPCRHIGVEKKLLDGDRVRLKGRDQFTHVVIDFLQALRDRPPRRSFDCTVFQKLEPAAFIAHRAEPDRRISRVNPQYRHFSVTLCIYFALTFILYYHIMRQKQWQIFYSLKKLHLTMRRFSRFSLPASLRKNKGAADRGAPCPVRRIVCNFYRVSPALCCVWITTMSPSCAAGSISSLPDSMSVTS